MWAISYPQADEAGSHLRLTPYIRERKTGACKTTNMIRQLIVRAAVRYEALIPIWAFLQVEFAALQRQLAHYSGPAPNY